MPRPHELWLWRFNCTSVVVVHTRLGDSTIVVGFVQKQSQHLVERCHLVLTQCPGKFCRHNISE